MSGNRSTNRLFFCIFKSIVSAFLYRHDQCNMPVFVLNWASHVCAVLCNTCKYRWHWPQFRFFCFVFFHQHIFFEEGFALPFFFLVLIRFEVELVHIFAYAIFCWRVKCSCCLLYSEYLRVAISLVTYCALCKRYGIWGYKYASGVLLGWERKHNYLKQAIARLHLPAPFEQTRIIWFKCMHGLFDFHKCAPLNNRKI